MCIRSVGFCVNFHIKYVLTHFGADLAQNLHLLQFGLNNDAVPKTHGLPLYMCSFFGFFQNLHVNQAEKN